MPKFCVAIEIVSKKLDSCLVLFHVRNGNAEANKNNNSLETTTQNLTSQQYSSTAVSHSPDAHQFHSEQIMLPKITLVSGPAQLRLICQ